MLSVFGFNKKKGNSKDVQELDDEALEMMDKVRGLKQTTAKEIMVPRIDIISVKLQSKLREVVEKFQDGGYSRLPVFDKTVDDIVGIIYIKDLFNMIVKEINLDETELDQEMLKQAYFVPETKKINVLLKEFQNKKIHLAIVVDEYGGFSGIVTLEDILEEIVGEIQDEYDDEDEDVIRVDRNTFNCDARGDIEEINKKLNIDLPLDNVDTLGGFVYNLFGKIPHRDDNTSYENIDFKILSIEKNIIDRILVTINEKPTEENSIED